MAKRAARQSSKRIPTAKLAHIHENFRSLAVPIGEPVLDPENANSHTDEGMALIGDSVSEFQQIWPIVVNKPTGIVLAGNGTLKAMRKRKFEYVAVTVVDFDPAQAKKFSVVANQTGRLSHWNTDQLLKILDELETDGIEHLELGFDDDDIAELIQEASGEAPEKPVRPKQQKPPKVAGKFQILVDCKDAEDQREKLKQLVELKWRCTAIEE